MQVSAINSSPNFSSRTDISRLDSNIDELVETARRCSYGDNTTCQECICNDDGSYEVVTSKQPVMKSDLESAAALICAFLIPFGIGKGIAAKTIDFANTNKVASDIVKFANKNVIKAGQLLAEQGNKVLNNEGSNKLLRKSVELISNAASTVSKKASEIKNPTKLFTSLVGVAAVVKNTPPILRSDNNNDTIPDYLQEGVDAYRGTTEKLGKFGELLTAAYNIVV